jgi:tetratricopeptide (TPR) repeat protein
LRRSLLVALVVSLLPAVPASAGDPPPTDFGKSLAATKSLVEQEKWVEGEAALRKLFSDFKDDPRVGARILEIEDRLQVCVFRRAQPQFTGAELFGAPAKRFNAATRDVEFEFAGCPAPLWRKVEDGNLFILGVRFEGALTIDASIRFVDSANTLAYVVLCWDLEKRGGYTLCPGYWMESAGRRLSAEATIKKIGPKGLVELANSASSGYIDAPYGTGQLAVSRTGSDIVAKVGGKAVVRATDPTYANGYVGVSGRVERLVVKGRLEKHAFRKLAAERHAKRFAEWLEKSWDREKEIPQWAREAAAAPPDVTLLELPADAPSEGRAELVSLVESAAENDLVAALRATLESGSQPPDTALYLLGLGKLAVGAYKEAEEAFAKLAEAEPEFVPARLFLGAARFHLRRIEAAKRDLAWTLERRPKATRAIVLSALLSLFEQDFAAADAAFAKAAELGVWNEDVDQARDWIHRAKAGPNLAQRFQTETDRFVVVGDTSQKVCYDAAALLESMQTKYAAAVGPAPPSRGKARVYVFSGRQGYLDYAADLGVTAHSTAGVYLPALRELMIWIPIDMTDFADTVRHEGFHQYLHRLVETAPVWFNEGYAEVMGGGGPEGVRDAKRDARFVKDFMPVSELVAMRQPAFIAVAGVAYTESRYLVDFLRRTKNAKLKTVLADYFAAVVSGLSQEEANEKVLAPVMDLLQSEFTNSL